MTLFSPDYLLFKPLCDLKEKQYLLCDGQRSAEVVKLFVLKSFVHLLERLLPSLPLLLQMLLQVKILVTKRCWWAPLGDETFPCFLHGTNYLTHSVTYENLHGSRARIQ